MSKTFCVFAGQGAQAPGMGRDFAEDIELSALFASADQALGFDLSRCCFNGTAEELTRSNICQPAIFLVSVAAYRVFLKRCPGAVFDGAGGLSLGEWTALHVGGALDFESALRILEARGRFMQEACEAQDSGMISVMGASPEQLEAICSRSGLVVANINSDAQVVLSGLKPGVAVAATAAAELGLKAVPLSVAGAFHSPVMAPAREKLAAVIETVAFRTPSMPVLSNVSGRFHQNAPTAIKDAMLRQVTEPVRWADCIRTARAVGAERFVEFGPGKVLSGLIRRIDKSAQTLNVADAASLEQAAAAFA